MNSDSEDKASNLLTRLAFDRKSDDRSLLAKYMIQTYKVSIIVTVKGQRKIVKPEIRAQKRPRCSLTDLGHIWLSQHPVWS